MEKMSTLRPESCGNHSVYLTGMRPKLRRVPVELVNCWQSSKLLR